METLTLEGSGSVKARKLQRVSASFAPAAGATAAPCHVEFKQALQVPLNGNYYIIYWGYIGIILG